MRLSLLRIDSESVGQRLQTGLLLNSQLIEKFYLCEYT